ncbi:uncharacterized protein LOC119673491 [Teleopsis dalmanni]|uniref:uncharacterized protein LOC119673438 n=1 Tax=Teleopsis dalmanni TaxID=139649 RepID=UPI0018CCCBF6|nr:uncharacterized protein LOC119673438 [Teleopsis dalmanni]XP_037940709.1 uncharacterized protein LOC119673491 [Teleopsis dalmanni]
MDVAAVKELLKEQQEINKKMWEDQRAFFKEMLVGRVSDGETNAVPAFHAYKKQLHSWETYLEQLHQHFSAHSVDKGKYKSFFLTWIGTETYDILRSNLGSKGIETKTYDELTKGLTDYFLAKTHVVAARHEFHKATMRSDQTYREWITDLRRVARECKFVCSASTKNKSHTL